VITISPFVLTDPGHWYIANPLTLAYPRCPCNKTKQGTARYEQCPVFHKIIDLFLGSGSHAFPPTFSTNGVCMGNTKRRSWVLARLRLFVCACLMEYQAQFPRWRLGLDIHRTSERRLGLLPTLFCLIVCKWSSRTIESCYEFPNTARYAQETYQVFSKVYGYKAGREPTIILRIINKTIDLVKWTMCCEIEQIPHELLETQTPNQRLGVDKSGAWILRTC